MKLTPEEETLIKALREIDRRNPAGVDNFTTAEHLSMCMTIARSGIENGGKRYKLFLKQARRGQLIDLQEVHRAKFPADDPRP